MRPVLTSLFSSCLLQVVSDVLVQLVFIAQGKSEFYFSIRSKEVRKAGSEWIAGRLQVGTAQHCLGYFETPRE